MDRSDVPEAMRDDAQEVTQAPRPAVPYPEYLTIESPYKQEVKRIKVDRWISEDYAKREVERIWKKVWQVACREEEIPNVGDYIVYEIANLSFIVMHSAQDEYRAYWNSCPHRGRKVADFDGHGVSELRCMYHGWSWNIDGSPKKITCAWDFPGGESEFGLVEAKTGRWGGFVFINPDPAAEPLADFLGTMPEHYEKAGHDFSKRWKQVHVAAVLDCNWKIAQEAFLEPWHVVTTHPQFVFERNNDNPSDGRWDDFGNFMRGAPHLPTDQQEPKPGWAVTSDDDQEVLDSYYERHLNMPPEIVTHPGVRPTQQIIENARALYRGIIGDKIDEYHDVELFGGHMASLFPNLHPWGAFSHICYRYRPYGTDPDRCIMEVMLLAAWPEDQPRPPAAKAHWLKPGETVADAPELGQLARIFTQDLGNVVHVQAGLKTNGLGHVMLAMHNETPVRHFHDLYEKWMGLADGE